MYDKFISDIVMHQRGDGDPGESAEVFVDPKPDMYLFSHFAPPFFPSSVFAAFCSAAPLEKLVYILAVITAELVLPVFIQTAKNTAAAFSGPYSAAAASAAGALPPASTAPVRQFLRLQFQ